MEYAGHDDAAAIRTLEELLRHDETYTPAYHQLGILYARMNRSEEARMVFQKGISVARLQNDHHAAEEMREAFNELRTP
jgi:Tfp pilus assembly protein PilF